MAIVYGTKSVTNVLPSLDLRFSYRKDLVDAISGKNLIDFSRVQSGTSKSTYFGADGILKYADSNEPRFDHDPTTGESLGLLVEESRSNELPNSMPTTSGGGITNTQVTGLSGVFSTARRFTSAGGDDVRIMLGFNTSGVKFTYSFYARLGTQGTSAFIRNGTSVYVNFNLSTGVPTNSGWDSGSAYMIDVGNGWYRCYASVTGTGVSGFLFGVANGNGLYSNAGDNIIAGGFQLERGTFPTSYIPTNGGTLTRTADVMSITGTNFSSWYNNNEGTFFTDMALGFTQNAGNPFTFGGVFYTTVVGSIRTLANTPTIMGGLSNSQTVPSKTAVALKSQDFRVYRDGIQTGSNTSLSYTPTGTQLLINSSLGSKGHIGRIAYYPQRLQDSTLQKLTR
jgi:hypothetical protein